MSQKFPVVAWPNKLATAVPRALPEAGDPFMLQSAIDDVNSWMMDETEAKETQIIYRLRVTDPQ